MTNAKEIYTYFRQQGLSEAGALGLMGNLQAESGLYPCRLQGDFSADFHKSREYADKVDNGILSIEQAAGDAKGWGLPQWTYRPRKLAFFRYALMHSVSIANLQVQLDYIMIELDNEYQGLLQFLRFTDDMYEATSRVCKEYERPAINNVDARYAFAKGLREVEGKDDVPDIDVGHKSEFWPPRMICKGMDGQDVGVLQSVLRARGYTLSDAQDIFGSSTDKALRKAQEDLSLTVDGVCGPKSWTALLKI